MVINIHDGDVVSGYKQHIVQDFISKNIWKFNYEKKWIKAGGGSLFLNGRHYFGGSINVDSVETAAKNLLKYSGVDDTGISKIREANSNDHVNHVYVNFLPQQTFTIEGLTSYFKLSLYPKLEALGSVSFSFNFTTEWMDKIEKPYPIHSFKKNSTTTATEQKLYVFEDNDMNVTFEALYYITQWFEDSATIESVVNEIENQYDDRVQYETITTITLDDFSSFVSDTKITELFNLIYLGDSADDYYYFDSDLLVSYASGIWSSVYGFVSRDDGFSDALSDGGENFVIYHDGNYWVDSQMWKEHDADYCTFTLSKIFHIGIDQKEDNLFGGWFGSCCGVFLTEVAKFLDFIATSLGQAVYDLTIMPYIEVLKSTGAISDKSASDIKRIYIKVSGTIALAVLTWYIGGVAAAGSAGSAGAGAAAAGSAGAGAAAGSAGAGAAAGSAGAGAAAAGSAGAGAAAAGSAGAASGVVATVAGISVTYVDIILNLVSAVGAGYSEYNAIRVEDSQKKLLSNTATKEDDPIVFVYEESEDIGDIDIADMFIDNVYEYMDYESGADIIS